MSFEMLKNLKTNFPFFHLMSLNVLGSNSIGIDQSAFYFPSAPHPLTKFVKDIQEIQQSKLEPPAALQAFKNSYATLDESSLGLLTEKKIQDLLKNSEMLSQLYSIPTQDVFFGLDLDVKNRLAGLIYDLSKDRNKKNWGWGGAEHHVMDDPQCLKSAVVRMLDQDLLNNCEEKIQSFAIKFYQSLSQEDKNAVARSIYHLAGRPKNVHAQWGEDNATTNIARLISALHCQGKISGPLHPGFYIKSWENHRTPSPSQYYTIEGNELPKGEISLINGMGSPFDRARESAQRFKDDHCQGYALHCVYAAEQTFWDFASALLGQSLRILPQGRLLIQRWVEFFERSKSDEKYLQICTSRGAIDTAAALNALPLHLRKRLIVIAVAPGYIIDETLCYKAINLVIPGDSVPYLSPNSVLIGTHPVVRVLSDHTDKTNPHNFHGSSYHSVISILMRQYIQTNDIDISTS